MKEFHDLNTYLPGFINRLVSLVAVTLSLVSHYSVGILK